MNKYEATYIIRPDLEESAIQEVIEKVKGIITNNGGEIVTVDNWGMRKLAYDVKKNRTGYYSNMQFNGVAATVNELKRNFRIMDAVIKDMIIRLED